MDHLIECAELGFIRDIPAELLFLEKQNALLIKSNKTHKIILITMVSGIGLLLIIELVKTIKDEKRIKRKNGK